MAICTVIGTALGVGSGRRVVSKNTAGKEFRKAELNLIWSGEDLVTTARVRVNGIVKRAGVEYVGVSVACYAGDALEARSEDLKTSPSKCGVVMIADESGQPVAIDDVIRTAASTTRA